ncbi:MAG: hypothetical protein ACXWTG_10255 [Methylosarcina sp.]
MDEPPLTGKWRPVVKQSQALAKARLPLAERSSLLYMNNAHPWARRMMATEAGKPTGLLP